MELTVSQWGNSLGIRIPKAVAALMHVVPGQKMQATLEDGKLTLSNLPSFEEIQHFIGDLDLEAMMAQVTPENEHDWTEFDDPPRGKEVW